MAHSDLSQHLLPIEFGTDGIRGIAGEYPLDPATVLRIGRAIGRWKRSWGSATHHPILIGRDTRISGHTLLHALSAGLLAEGEKVIDLGYISTPGVSYAVQAYHAALGIVISASHNPYDQNGIKLFATNGFKLDDSAEEEIEKLIIGLQNESTALTNGQFEENPNAKTVYAEMMVRTLPHRALDNFRVVLDCANGAGFEIAPLAFRLAAAQVTTLNVNPDGYNINVNAGSEYVRRDRTALLKAIQAEKADLGIAFDGDADRIVFVTPEGMLIDGDHLMGILAIAYHDSGNLHGNAVVATDMSNSGLEHYLSQYGIKLIRTKVGDRYVMDEMRRGGYVLGGEQAGHVILLEHNLTAGDGIYTGLKVAALLAEYKRQGETTLYKLASRIPRYPQVIASAHLDRRVDLKTVAGLEALQQETLALFSGQGRVNLRFSGTEPNLLRAMVEGGANNTLEQVIEQALLLCKTVAIATETTSPKIDVVDCVTGAPVKV